MIQMVMAGLTHHRIGLLLLGVKQMLSLPIDYSGKMLMKMDLAMWVWGREETTVLLHRALQPEMFKAVQMKMVMVGLMNMEAGMQRFQ